MQWKIQMFYFFQTNYSISNGMYILIHSQKNPKMSPFRLSRNNSPVLPIICVTWTNIPWYLVFICPFHTLVYLKSNKILNQKVSDQCFIFSLDDLNETIVPWISIWRFSIKWMPSFLSMAPRGVYLASVILPLHF